MAQDESTIPTDGNSKRKSADLLPRYFRTTANKKFLSSTLDQLMQPGVVEKVDGFIGRRDAKAFKASEQLETGVVAVNTPVVATAETPFGGIKQTGYGREGGSVGIKDYLNIKYTHLGLSG